MQFHDSHSVGYFSARKELRTYKLEASALKICRSIFLCISFFSISLSGAYSQALGANRELELINTEAGNSFVIEKTTGLNLRYKPLINRLVAVGWDQEWLNQKFADPRAVFIPVLANTPIKRTRSNTSNGRGAYAWMYESKSDSACANFVRKYSKSLTNAERVLNVSREAISALLWCETRHGRVTGNYPLLGTFASISMMSHPTYVLRSIKEANFYLDSIGADSARRAEEISRIRERCVSRSAWAFSELQSLLTIEKNGYFDVLATQGSWAGAFGWAQFLPTSFLKFAIDGSGDKKVNLFNPSDAIFSVANYLHRAGFAPNNDAAVRRALRTYNRSYDYANAIANLAKRIAPPKIEENVIDTVHSPTLQPHPVTGDKD